MYCLFLGLWCIEEQGIRCLEKLGLQSQWLKNMTVVGPSVLLSPKQVFHGALSAGLLPTFIDPPDPDFSTVVSIVFLLIINYDNFYLLRVLVVLTFFFVISGRRKKICSCYLSRKSGVFCHWTLCTGMVNGQPPCCWVYSYLSYWLALGPSWNIQISRTQDMYECT